MNNMPSKKSIISLAIGSAFAATLGTASVASAGESPFATQALNKGYMVAESHYGEKREGHGGMKDQDKKYGEGRCGMSMADTDKDGRVSKEEHARHAQMMFEKMDANKDGYIDKDEANMMKKKHGQGHGQRSDDRSGYGDRSSDRSGYGDQSSDRSGYGDRSSDRSGYGDRSGERGYEERAGVGEEQYKYGTRATDRNLQHMKPMGE